MAELRLAIRAAIGDVWGVENIPEREDGFRAHVSLGYSNAAGPVEPVATALAEHPATTAQMTVSTVALIDLNRDRQAYVWDDVVTVQLGG